MECMVSLALHEPCCRICWLNLALHLEYALLNVTQSLVISLVIVLGLVTGEIIVAILIRRW